MKNLFIGNINFQTTESELRSIFEPFGEIQYIRIITDRETGRSRGFAFVDMSSDQDAQRAIVALNQTELGGRKLIVTEARPKPERTTTVGKARSYRPGFAHRYERTAR